MIVCVLVPRFALLVAVEDRELLLGPVALAPEPGREQAVGEVSGAAEAFGIRAGMPLGEALGRCPNLVLVSPDPDRAGSAWEALLRRLEGIGAAVESARDGEAFFDAEGLRDLWGGHTEGVMARARRALRAPARLGAGPTRFCAYVAAVQSRPSRARRSRRGDRRPEGVAVMGVEGGRAPRVPAGAARAFLAPLPVELLRGRLGREDDGLPEALERLGVRTLGELAAIPTAAIADRFGEPGLRASALASGRDEPLSPRSSREELSEGLDLPEAVSGPQLDRALALLTERLLAHPARRGRTFRRLRIAARLAAGGSWRAEAVLREATASAERLLLALSPKLVELPGPAVRLELSAAALGPVGHEQLPLVRGGRERRRARLAEAVRQARAAAGRDAVLRVLEVDPRSRVPERRARLTPFPEPQEAE